MASVTTQLNMDGCGALPGPGHNAIALFSLPGVGPVTFSSSWAMCRRISISAQIIASTRGLGAKHRVAQTAVIHLHHISCNAKAVYSIKSRFLLKKTNPNKQ